MTHQYKKLPVTMKMWMQFNVMPGRTIHGADSCPTVPLSILPVTTHDQFAFRPTGSPTAAIISLFNTLLTNPMS